MPSVKQGGGYTLTFSKKNEDIKELLIEKRKIKGFVLTDYICDAIRFFEANKDEKKKITNINIEELVKQEVAKILKYHTDIRHIRGGESTKRKYLSNKAN